MSEATNGPEPVPGEDYPYDNLPQTRRRFHDDEYVYPLRIVYERARKAWSGEPARDDSST